MGVPRRVSAATPKSHLPFHAMIKKRERESLQWLSLVNNVTYNCCSVLSPAFSKCSTITWLIAYRLRVPTLKTHNPVRCKIKKLQSADPTLRGSWVSEAADSGFAEQGCLTGRVYTDVPESGTLLVSCVSCEGHSPYCNILFRLL